MVIALCQQIPEKLSHSEQHKMIALYEAVRLYLLLILMKQEL